MELIELSKYKIKKYYDTSKLENIINKFGKDNNILVKYDNIFTIYSNKPMKHSNDLANLLYTEYDNHIALYTHLPNKEFMIQIDGNNMIYIYLCRDSIENQIYLELMFEYKKLYTINNFYSEIIESDLIDNIPKIENNDKEIKITYKYKILKDFYETNELDIILLDYYALISENINYNTTMNMIIDTDIKIIKKILDKIIKKNKIKAKINIISNDSYYIAHDFRLKKETIYMTINNTKIYLMNIYNSMQYEILPIRTNINKFMIPHRVVLLRFLFIDLYLNKLYNAHLDNIYYLIQEINKIDDSRENCIWVGIYRDESNDKILEIKNNERQYFPYYPQKYYINNNNNLRYIK